jgi:hypothetical protein
MSINCSMYLEERKRFSIGCGAIFFPPELTKRCFFRSVMWMNPSSSVWPMSPV